MNCSYLKQGVYMRSVSIIGCGTYYYYDFTALSEVTEADRTVKMWNGAEGLLVMCTSSLI